MSNLSNRGFDLLNRTWAGFSLLEIAIVIALFFIILTITVPYGLRFFNVERLDSASRELLEVLRLAQAQAASQMLDSDFGVLIEAGSFTFFRGTSYLGRDPQYDQVFYLSDQIALEGLPEVVFEKLSGFPYETGEIILASGERSNVISINAEGMISLDLGVSLAAP